MRPQRFIAFGAVVFALSLTGCKDQPVRDWLVDYTMEEQAYLVEVENQLNSLVERVCVLEGVPCPGSDVVGPPPPRDWP